MRTCSVVPPVAATCCERLVAIELRLSSSAHSAATDTQPGVRQRTIAQTSSNFSCRPLWAWILLWHAA
eukprot:8287004-Alexandrium_andersonii.AAC.1